MVLNITKLLESEATAENAERRKLFWVLQIGGWFTVALLSVYPLVQLFDPRTIGVILLLRMGSGMLITLGMREIYRRLPWREWAWWSLGSGVLLLCLVMGTLDSLTTHVLARLITSTTVSQEVYSFLVTTGIMLRFSILTIWSLLYFGIKLWMETAEVKLRAARSEASARTSELKQLRSQVNPHFLFNALNSILAEKDSPEAVERITQELAGYLRFSLRPSGDCQPLGEEVDALEHYLRVEKARFEEKLVYEIDVSPEARLRRVPVATVQPLLENAMKYGWKTSPAPLRIVLSAEILPESDHLKITVANTGRWLEFDAMRSHGIGLVNLGRRLELLFGAEARLSHREMDEGWVMMEVVIPAEPIAERRNA